MSSLVGDKDLSSIAVPPSALIVVGLGKGIFPCLTDAVNDKGGVSVAEGFTASDLKEKARREERRLELMGDGLISPAAHGLVVGFIVSH